MKIKNRLLLVLMLVLIAAMQSCNKQLNTNLTNPNGLPISALSGSQLFAQSLLTTVTNKIGANAYNGGDNYDYAAEWMQFFARDAGWAPAGVQARIEGFSMSNNDANGNWASLYHNIYDYNYVMTHSSTGSILPGASRVIRSMLFQDLVDQFGNIPYFQASQGTAYLTPAYDSATTIYKDLILQLDTAISAISSSQSTSDDASDIMFKGSKTLWLQFANTIKLRILLRQVPNTGNTNYVATEIGNIVSQGNGFLGVGQDATIQPGFTDASFKQNPFWGDYGFSPGGRTASPYQNYNFYAASQPFISALNALNDVRVGYYYGTDSNNTGVEYVGEYLGNNNTPNPSQFGPGLLQSPTAPALLFSAAQSLFMQAEAVQRGLMTGNFAGLYQEAVEESFRYLGVPSYKTAADNYISSNAGNQNVDITAGNPLQTILYQKWIAECGLDGLEAYSDYRRTGIPAIPNPSQATTSPIPLRLLYPETEYTQNATNVQAENQSSADIYTKIFWGQ